MFVSNFRGEWFVDPDEKMRIFVINLMNYFLKTSILDSVNFDPVEFWSKNFVTWGVGDAVIFL